MHYTLEVPEDIYTRALEIARTTAQPVEQVLVDQLMMLTLPPDEQAELNALRQLSDDALWSIAAEQMAESIQTRMQILMERNSRGQITEDEYQELAKLVERGNRLMVRKAEASGILMERGHPFTPQDYTRKHE
ncbi:MAG: hypothetical protein K8J31_17725 [Anaerolineae bacterium]|nr:hypothetical protein [Anaerolineae bacterium]